MVMARLFVGLCLFVVLKMHLESSQAIHASRSDVCCPSLDCDGTLMTMTEFIGRNGALNFVEATFFKLFLWNIIFCHSFASRLVTFLSVDSQGSFFFF
jgi:hypothetical protein